MGRPDDEAVPDGRVGEVAQRVGGLFDEAVELGGTRAGPRGVEEAGGLAPGVDAEAAEVPRGGAPGPADGGGAEEVRELQRA